MLGGGRGVRRRHRVPGARGGRGRAGGGGKAQGTLEAGAVADWAARMRDVKALFSGPLHMAVLDGVDRSAEEGARGQGYGRPADAIKAGSDAVIVGSGIHGTDDPATAARAYAEATWSALSDR